MGKESFGKLGEAGLQINEDKDELVCKSATYILGKFKMGKV